MASKSQPSFDDFLAFYSKNGFCLGAFSRERKCWNEKELKAKYEKYIRSLSRAEEKQAQKKEFERPIPDPSGPMRCSLIERLQTDPERCHLEIQLSAAGSFLLHQIDRAHVFGRGPFPHMKYDIDNLVWLNRWSHNNLDQYRDPISGKSISAEDVEWWWRYIVGNERYDRLANKSRRKDNVGTE